MPYKDPEKAKKCAERYRKSPKGKLSQKKRNAVFRAKPENKEAARQYAYNYVRTEQGKKAMRRGVLKKYGLTLEDYDKILRKQKNVCLFCGEPPRLNTNLDVEHDHKTKTVRGLVHRRCNSFIAIVEKYIEQVKRYIVKSRKLQRQIDNLRRPR
jgi:hypothetical protein